MESVCAQASHIVEEYDSSLPQVPNLSLFVRLTLQSKITFQMLIINISVWILKGCDNGLPKFYIQHWGWRLRQNRFCLDFVSFLIVFLPKLVGGLPVSCKVKKLWGSWYLLMHASVHCSIASDEHYFYIFYLLCLWTNDPYISYVESFGKR